MRALDARLRGIAGGFGHYQTRTQRRDFAFALAHLNIGRLPLAAQCTQALVALNNAGMRIATAIDT